jgi:hypothetical protein
MSNAELLLKEIEGLPANDVAKVIDFVGHLKHGIPPAPKKNKDWRALYGLFKSDGHEVDRFLERSHADKLLEDEIDKRHRKEREQFAK